MHVARNDHHETLHRQLMTTREACEFLGVSAGTLSCMRDAGQIRAMRVGRGRGTWRYLRSSLEDLVEARVR